MTRLGKLQDGIFPPKTKEYRISEVDKYDNLWFEMKFSGIPEIQKRNAEQYVANMAVTSPDRKFVIHEIG